MPEEPEKTEEPITPAGPGGSTVWSRLLVVVALIAIVCLSLALVLVYGSESLTSGQVWFLSVFAAAFGVLGTSAVTWLILRHARKLSVAEGDGDLAWKVTPPEKQKRRLNDEVRELGSMLGTDGSHLADLRAAYIVAEDLAIRRVQNESGVPLMRKVSIGTADFDAVMIDRDRVILIAVTFLVRPNVSSEKISRYLREAAAAEKVVAGVRRGSRVLLLILLVTQLEKAEQDRLRATITDHFKSTPVDVDIRWMDFQELQKLYSE